jgi:hypothetical protein
MTFSWVPGQSYSVGIAPDGTPLFGTETGHWQVVESDIGGIPLSQPTNGFFQFSLSFGPVTLSLTADSHKNTFFSIGANYGKALPVGASFTRGFLNNKPWATSSTFCKTLSGFSANGSAGAILGGTESYTPSNGQWATQFGLFSPQIGLGANYGIVLSGCGGN